MLESLETATTPPEPDVEPVSPATIQSNLYEVLSRQVITSPPSNARYVQLIMAGLTDDLFLTKEWYGQTWWHNNPIEYKLFGTRTAGDEVFNITDQLYSERDMEAAPIAQVLIDAIALGFKGKYAGTETGVPRTYVEGLYEIVHLGCSKKDSDGRKTIFPDAYRWNFTPSSQKNLPALREWLIGAAIIAVLLLIISHIAWTTAIAPLDELLDKPIL